MCNHPIRYGLRLAALLAFCAILTTSASTAQNALPSLQEQGLQPERAPTASAVQDDYSIREGDLVQMSVFNEPELAVSGKIRKDGTLQCPLIGSVRLVGLSQNAAARLVENLYRKDYLVNPEVTLFVSQFATQRITVLGQVLRPGSLELPPEKQLTILQALGMAGGPTRIANLKRVTVKRQVNGKQESIKLDVNSMLNDGREKVFFVQEDDVITVPESLF